jgi:hypothetical protein
LRDQFVVGVLRADEEISRYFRRFLMKMAGMSGRARSPGQRCQTLWDW